MTVISAPTASRQAPAVASASASAQPGAFDSILQGVLDADASAGAAVEADAATGDGLNAALGAFGETPMNWPAGQPRAVASSDDQPAVPAPADATAPVVAFPLSSEATPSTTATPASVPTTGTPTTAIPAPARETAEVATEFAGVPIDDVTPASSPTAANPGASAATRPLPGLTTEVSAAEPTTDPALTRLAPPATTDAPTPLHVPATPGTAAAGESASSQPAPPVPVDTAGTPTANTARVANPASPIATTMPPPAAAGAIGAASPSAEGPTSVPSLTVPAGPQSPEPALPPVHAVSTPAPAAPATVAAPAPVPASPPAAAQPLTTQLAQPLFSLAGARPGEHVMTVQVTPENLGPVTVRAVISADGIQIELFSPSDGGRDALRQILTDLRRDLAGGGLSASLDLSSRDTEDSREQRAPVREPARDDASAAAPAPERLSAQPAEITTTLDITV